MARPVLRGCVPQGNSMAWPLLRVPEALRGAVGAAAFPCPLVGHTRWLRDIAKR